MSVLLCMSVLVSGTYPSTLPADTCASGYLTPKPKRWVPDADPASPCCALELIVTWLAAESESYQSAGRSERVTRRRKRRVEWNLGEEFGIFGGSECSAVRLAGKPRQWVCKRIT